MVTLPFAFEDSIDCARLWFISSPPAPCYALRFHSRWLPRNHFGDGFGLRRFSRMPSLIGEVVQGGTPMRIHLGFLPWGLAHLTISFIRLCHQSDFGRPGSSASS